MQLMLQLVTFIMYVCTKAYYVLNDAYLAGITFVLTKDML